jgi:hypothetical protein
MKLKASPGLAFLVLAASLHAQESLVGKYSGTFNLQTQSRGVLPIAVSLNITSAANGKLLATASRSHNGKAGMGCVGEYKLEGSYEGNKIDMKSDAGGPAKDCVMRFELVADGNKLKGKMGQSDVEFSR